MKKLLSLIIVLFLMISCSSQSDYKIGQYISLPNAYSTNSFWIEGPTGIVLIDTQFLPSAAIAAVEKAQRTSGKKVVMAIVLHANPDRFNGVQVLRERGIQVVSAEQVVEQIPAMHNKTWPVFYQRLKPDYPDALILPDALWNKTTNFEVAGLKLKAYVVRDAVSKNHLLIELDEHLFVGDLLANQFHTWPGIGNSDHWLERLQEIRQFIDPKVIHPGRGNDMPAEALLTEQENYLHFLQQSVAQSYTGGEMTEADKAEITTKMVNQFPTYKLDKLLRYTIAAEWKHQRASDHQMLEGQAKTK